jgi:hypothetical protein
MFVAEDGRKAWGKGRRREGGTERAFQTSEIFKTSKV